MLLTEIEINSGEANRSCKSVLAPNQGQVSAIDDPSMEYASQEKRE